MIYINKFDYLNYVDTENYLQVMIYGLPGIGMIMMKQVKYGRKVMLFLIKKNIITECGSTQVQQEFLE